MKSLIIYYSLEGNTKFIAENIAKEINSDILELKVKKEYPKNGFKKFFWGGKDVLFNKKPELFELDVDLNKYDYLFIGTPIWAGTYAPPFNTFISEYNIENKKIALFACHGGGGAEKFYVNFKNKLPQNDYIGEFDFVDPLKGDTNEHISKIKEWLTNLNIK
ncbi:flavodoxin [Clostridium sp. SHJSY1]|uniref:flavodoxin family protein n=1 Tax=Clostridium sp. SHJSY1 TaxID=2942483 RepID=UPI002875F667|nr:flavodoxin [Clostridium sp. SHJSY1]MDS0527486.1 flavodoxin [Clostridium sp. SHJSY1]